MLSPLLANRLGVEEALALEARFTQQVLCPVAQRPGLYHQHGERHRRRRPRLRAAGAARDERGRGERADNIERAIAHYEMALTVDTDRSCSSEDWATSQHNLANAYSKRICGERADNLEAALERYEAAPS